MKGNKELEKPSWIKVRHKLTGELIEVENFLEKNRVHTVCSSAMCPNRGECFGKQSMTFLILGPHCTRGCGFCSVDKNVHEPYIDFENDNRKILDAVKKFKLRYVTITSPTRDDLPDGGAGVFADVITTLRKLQNSPAVEALIPDFMGDEASLDRVTESRPEVLAHNLETIPRLYKWVRKGADWGRSLGVLRRSVQTGKSLVKTALMVGLGETNEEILDAMKKARESGAEIIVIGQYLRPTREQVPVERYVTPDEFRMFEEEGKRIGYKVTLAGPFYRSSYLAEETYRKAMEFQGGQG